MKRKMVHIGFSYISGLFFASFFNFAAQIPFLLILSFAFAVFLCIRKPGAVCTLVWVCSFLTGFGLYKAYDTFVYDKISAFASGEISFAGKITQIDDFSADSSSYRVRGRINGIQRAEIIFYTDSMECSRGDFISFSAKAQEFENTYLFAQKDYYMSEGIFLKAYDGYDIQITRNDSFSLISVIQDYRDKITAKIRSVLPGENGALITAMLVGQKDGLDEDTQTLLYRCGIGHAMAVSGMHLAVAAAVICALTKRIYMRRSLRFILMESGIILFVIFSGMSVSVVRSAVMITLVYGACIFGRKPDPLNSLCLAAVILSLFNPFIIHNVSFLLSWAGTFGVTVFAPYMTSDIDDRFIWGKIKKYAANVFCISASVFPFSVMYFDEISAVSLLSDLIIMPLCICVLVCGLIVSLTGGAGFILSPVLIIGAGSASLIIKLSDFLGRFRLSYIASGYVYMVPLVIILSIFVVITALMLKKPYYTAWSIVLSAAVLCISGIISSYADRDNLMIYMLGDEKSSVMAVSHGNNTDVIDLTGNKNDPRYASKLCRGYGLYEINSLSIPRNAYASAVSYDRHLSLTRVRHVYLPEGTFMHDDQLICGCRPEYTDFSDVCFIYGDYTAAFTEDHTVSIDFGGHSIDCSPSRAEFDSEYPVDVCDSVIRINKEGKISIRSLVKGKCTLWEHSQKLS
ncbi:MAG: ComEC/Rec2 family competence protein [Oscillospiraceae bacterium]|nr:ComEC/Rec2 family competence protein [Oscillospiraceae bacterium]